MASEPALPKILRLILMGAALTALATAADKPKPPPVKAPDPLVPFSVVEASIPQMTEALKQGRITSRELVTQYLVRIALRLIGLAYAFEQATKRRVRPPIY
jgi:hypothetical protein